MTTIHIEKHSANPGTAPSEETQNVRQRLLKSAIKLFGEKGYAATSVNEIVTSAGVTKPNLYYYFTNKEGIYIAILSEALTGYDEIFNRASQAQGSARQRLMEICIEVYQQFVRNIDTSRMIYSVYFGPHQSAPPFDFETFRMRHFQLLYDLILYGISIKEFRAGDPHIMTLAVLGQCHTAMELELCHSGPTLGQEGLTKVLELLFESFAINRTAITEE